VRRGRRLDTLAGLVVLAGCATTTGVSGPVAWQAVDSTVRGDSFSARYEFTLVLRETAGQALTFTTLGMTPAFGRHGEQGGRWELPAHGELRLPIAARFTCSGHASACRASGQTLWYHITLTGRDEQGRPVRIPISVTLPKPSYGATETRPLPAKAPP
jgi:hypothetical protein